MESMLSQSMTPGWNDPPNLGGATPPVASHRLAHLRKHLVDPSLSGVCNAAQISGNISHHAGRQPSGLNGNGYGDSNITYVSQNYGVVPGATSTVMSTSMPISANVATPATADFSPHHNQQYNYHGLANTPNAISASQVLRNNYVPPQSQLQFTGSNQTYQNTSVPSADAYSAPIHSYDHTHPQHSMNQGINIRQQSLVREQDPYCQRGVISSNYTMPKRIESGPEQQSYRPPNQMGYGTARTDVSTTQQFSN